MRAVAAVAVAVALALTVLSGCGAQDGPTAVCTVTGSAYEFTSEQAANAAVIAAVGRSQRATDQAVTVALATAMQESRLRNLDYGDRDSLGIFQQRPSQGWGSPQEVTDVRYAATRFYRALSEIPGWESLRLTEAAQAVQRSAFPEAYEQWADEAAALTRALSGAVAALSCTAGPAPARSREARRAAITDAVSLDLAVTADGTGPALAWPAPVDSWPLVAWLVAHSEEFGLVGVGYAGRRWTPQDGWGEDAGAGSDRVSAQLS